MTLPPALLGLARVAEMVPSKLLVCESGGALGCWWDWCCPRLLSPLWEELAWEMLKDGVLDLSCIGVFG